MLLIAAGIGESKSHRFIGADGCGLAVGVVWRVCTGEGLICFTPLFQYNLDPNLMQVKTLPLNVCLVPAFEHFAPGVTDALDTGIVLTIIVRARRTGSAKRFISLSLRSSMEISQQVLSR
jgi:hypothetical protein